MQVFMQWDYLPNFLLQLFNSLPNPDFIANPGYSRKSPQFTNVNKYVYIYMCGLMGYEYINMYNWARTPIFTTWWWTKQTGVLGPRNVLHESVCLLRLCNREKWAPAQKVVTSRGSSDPRRLFVILIVSWKIKKVTDSSIKDKLFTLLYRAVFKCQGQRLLWWHFCPEGMALITQGYPAAPVSVVTVARRWFQGPSPVGGS